MRPEMKPSGILAINSTAYPDTPGLADLFGQAGTVRGAAGENPFFWFRDCRLAPSKSY
jgi:hypothetical protein